MADLLDDVFGSDLGSEDEARLREHHERTKARSDIQIPRNTSSPSNKILDPKSDQSLHTPTASTIKSNNMQSPKPISFADEGDEEEPTRRERASPSSPLLSPDHTKKRRRNHRREDLSADEYSDGDDDSEREFRRRKEREKRRRLQKAALNKRNRDDERHIHDENRIPSAYDDDDDRDRSRENSPEPEKPKKPLTAFEKAVEDNKALRRPRKKEMDPSKVEAECVDFLHRMTTARDDDIVAYKNGKPALNKLRMLKEVEMMLTKVHHREMLMDNMLLAVIKAWLDPMPDGALPNVQIRTTLLQVLMSMRVDEDWVERLESSQGLGRLIHYLSRKEDHEPNRRMAGKLLDKWARPVYNSNANYNDLLDEFDKPDEGHRAPREGVASERKAAMHTVKHYQTTREKIQQMNQRAGRNEHEQILAPVPRPNQFLFTTLAEGSSVADHRSVRENRSNKARTKKVNKTMSTLRRMNKNNAARAAKPSINGR